MATAAAPAGLSSRMFYGMQNKTQASPVIASEWEDDVFNHFNRIPRVVLIFKETAQIEVMEFNHAGRLMRQLDHLGKSGVRLMGIFTTEGVADVRSVRALTVYLRHGPGLETFRRAPRLYRNAHPWHKFGWMELRRHLGLRFYL